MPKFRWHTELLYILVVSAVLWWTSGSGSKLIGSGILVFVVGYTCVLLVQRREHGEKREDERKDEPGDDEGGDTE